MEIACSDILNTNAIKPTYTKKTTLEYIAAMLFSVSNLEKYWKVEPQGVLHVGAHLAEESESYEKQKWTPIIWVEGQEELVTKLQTRLNPEQHAVFQAYVWDSSGVSLTFKKTSNSQSSSLLEMGSHSIDYPEVLVTEEYRVVTTKLDDILPTGNTFDFVNLDIQGVELKALQGLVKHFSHIQWIYTEVNQKLVYKECTLINDLDAYLKIHNFRRVATRWVDGKGWGDALYVRSEKQIPRRYFLHRMALQSNWRLISFLIRCKRLVAGTRSKEKNLD